jgi:hypothetical protein
VPGSFGTLVQRGRAFAAVVLLAVGCGGGAGYGPVAQCQASQLHGPLHALGAPGLDCSAVEWDFGVVHDFAIFFGAGSQQQIEQILSGFSYEVATTAGQNYAGGSVLYLDPSGSNLALGLFQILTYPSGWTTPHNPYSEAPTIGNYLCDMKSMRLDAPAPDQGADAGC